MGEEIIPFESDDFLFVQLACHIGFWILGTARRCGLCFYGPEGGSK